MCPALRVFTRTPRDDVVVHVSGVAMPQPYRAPQLAPPGSRLYEGAALAGALMVFLAPALALLAGATVFVAGTLGYSGIALFVGGVAARYGFAEHPKPSLQLLKNLLVAVVVTGVFYLIFLLIVV